MYNMNGLDSQLAQLNAVFDIQNKRKADAEAKKKAKKEEMMNAPIKAKERLEKAKENKMPKEIVDLYEKDYKIAVKKLKNYLQEEDDSLNKE